MSGVLLSIEITQKSNTAVPDNTFSFVFIVIYDQIVGVMFNWYFNLSRKKSLEE